MTTAATDTNGDVSFTFNPATLAGGQVITATATSSNGNTSEFSACKAVAAAGDIQFTNATYQVNENGGPAAITLTRVGGSSAEIRPVVTPASAPPAFGTGALTRSRSPGPALMLGFLGGEAVGSPFARKTRERSRGPLDRPPARCA